MKVVTVLGKKLLSSNELSFSNNPQYSALNTGDFKLTVTVTPTNDAYPRSYCPFYFSSNPTHAATNTGLSIGHRQSKTGLEVRMADGGKAQVKTFKYP